MLGFIAFVGKVVAASVAAVQTWTLPPWVWELWRIIGQHYDYVTFGAEGLP